MKLQKLVNRKEIIIMVPHSVKKAPNMIFYKINRVIA